VCTTNRNTISPLKVVDMVCFMVPISLVLMGHIDQMHMLKTQQLPVIRPQCPRTAQTVQAS
jgi:hypothetical protein